MRGPAERSNFPFRFVGKRQHRRPRAEHFRCACRETPGEFSGAERGIQFQCCGRELRQQALKGAVETS